MQKGLSILATHSAVSSKLKQTSYLLLADGRRGEIHGVDVQEVGGGVFALNPGAYLCVGAWSGSEQLMNRRERGTCIFYEGGRRCCGGRWAGPRFTNSAQFQRARPALALQDELPSGYLRHFPVLCAGTGSIFDTLCGDVQLCTMRLRGQKTMQHVRSIAQHAFTFTFHYPPCKQAARRGSHQPARVEHA